MRPHFNNGADVAPRLAVRHLAEPAADLVPVGTAVHADADLSASPKDDAPTAENGQGATGQSDVDGSHCAESEVSGKAFATLQARAALKGCQLRALAGGGYLMSQWAYSREVPDLRTVGDLLRRMGA